MKKKLARGTITRPAGHTGRFLFVQKKKKEPQSVDYPVEVDRPEPEPEPQKLTPSEIFQKMQSRKAQATQDSLRKIYKRKYSTNKQELF